MFKSLANISHFTRPALAPHLAAPAASASSAAGPETSAPPEHPLQRKPHYIGRQDSKPLSTWEWVRLKFVSPDNARDKHPDDPSRYSGPAWRVESRAPQELMKDGGLRPRNTANPTYSLTQRVSAGVGNPADHSGLVSFAEDLVGTELVDFALRKRGAKEVYFYKVELDAANSFRAKSSSLRNWLADAVLDEREVLVANGVPLSDVVSVEIDDGAQELRTIRHPFTPRSDLKEDDFAYWRPRPEFDRNSTT